MKTVHQIISGNKLVLHFIFSALVLAGLAAGALLMFLQGYRFENNWSTAIDCLLFLLCIYTGRWLFRYWYIQRRLALFLVYTVSAYSALLTLKWLTVKNIFNHPFAGLLELAWDVTPFFLVGLIAGMLLKLVRTTIHKELLDARIQAEQKQSEFNVLQAQLSPHFLFNVLNNLYGISIEDHERVPGLLLKLSHLLRYSVYSSKKTFVPLAAEIEYVRNYIDFEQIRISDRLILQTDIETEVATSMEVAPMILIIFVENAFKHAKNSLAQQIQIGISLKISDHYIFFSVDNTYHRQEQHDPLLTGEPGIGLSNTVKRLDLLYGSDYELVQSAENDIYTIKLKVKIKYQEQ